MNSRVVLAAVIVVATLVVAGPSTGAENALPTEHPKASEFGARVDNPWFPLAPGTEYVYRGLKDGRPSREVLRVTHRTRLTEGVSCVVVDDRLYVRGHLAERTSDWYAQDRQGNVWYFGEETAELDPQGRVTSTEGSWESGRSGARAGVFMPAHPAAGQSGRQEYYKGHAEDHFAVVRLGVPVRVPYITSKAAMLIREWSPLEPAVLDHKFYVRGLGVVLEQTVKGGNERNALVSVRRGS